MIKDTSFGIIPTYKNNNWEYEFLIINQKTYNWSFVGFPKWHPEKWESNLETAKRELEEEVGITDIKLDENRFWWFSYKFKEKWVKYDKAVKYRLGYVKNKINKIEIEEVNSCKWVSFNEVMQLVTHKNMKKIFIEITKWLS
jgi:tRNA nucleotidyltransferase (CCA-adding enzyme)